MNRVTCGRWAIIHFRAAKSCFERGDLKSAEHWLFAAARRWNDHKRLSMRPEANLLAMRKVWSRCCFCGASNGLYWTSLKQHTSRCRYKGNANDFTLSVPNYYQMLDEDDELFLPRLRALPELERMNAEFKRIAAAINYDACEHPKNNDKKHSLSECVVAQFRAKQK